MIDFDNRPLITFDDPDLRLGAAVRDGRPAIVLSIEPVGSRTFTLAPAAAREFAARLIAAAAEADPEGHQAEIDAAARGLVERMRFEKMKPPKQH